MKKKIALRLLVFFLGIPLILALVLFDYNHHLTFQIAITIFVFLSSFEMHGILRKNHSVMPFPLIAVLSLFLPVTSLLCSLFEISQALVSYVFLFDFFTLAFCQVVFNNNEKKLKKAPEQIVVSVFIIFYSGFLLTFLQRLTLLDNSTFFIIVFLLMVFLSDSFAWAFGMVFGKNNRGLFKASPNKSIVGFIAGILSSVLVGYFAGFLSGRGKIQFMLIGLCVALTGILGDLFESIFKREANVKDSGAAIPGRGGALDSIDSLIFSAPVYVLLVNVCNL